MRYLFSFPYAAMALFLLYLGCKKGDDISNNPNTAFPLGKWKISYYFKKSDKTALYASYVFDFEAGGQLTVRHGNSTWKGSWSTGCDDSAPKLCLNFEASAPSLIRELAEDWRIVLMNATTIHLEHRSGGNGDTEVLHFSPL
jgi:hypothetical protein